MLQIILLSLIFAITVMIFIPTILFLGLFAVNAILETILDIRDAIRRMK